MRCSCPRAVSPPWFTHNCLNYWPVAHLAGVLTRTYRCIHAQRFKGGNTNFCAKFSIGAFARPDHCPHLQCFFLVLSLWIFNDALSRKFGWTLSRISSRSTRRAHGLRSTVIGSSEKDRRFPRQEFVSPTGKNSYRAH